MDPDVQTLSLEQWLELPLYSFQDWRKEHARGSSEDTSETLDANRWVSCGEVAQYYADYVNKMGLAGNFVGHAEIHQTCSLEKMMPCPDSSPQLTTCHSPSPTATSSFVSPASPTSPSLAYENPSTSKVSWERLTDLCSQICDPEDCGVYCCQRKMFKWKWYMRGTRNCRNGLSSEHKVCVFSQKLVLACGVQGNERRLKVPGEEEGEGEGGAARFLTYSYPEFVRRLGEGCITSNQVLVVGGGLSAADSVLLALKRGVKVVHVFEKDPFDQRLIFNLMPQKVYPRYKYIHRLMQEAEKNPNYVCCSRSQISAVSEMGFTVEGPTGELNSYSNIALGVVALGTDADLKFLPNQLLPKLGRHSDRPISAKHNPVDICPFSSVTEACPSLYAVGSLTGDNFVRFGVGSALGATQHILQLNT